MKATLALRAHTETRQKRRARERANHKHPPKWPPYALTFDAETRTDELQSLTFGFFRLLGNLNVNYTDVREEGIFYDPEEITASETRVLKKYVASKRAETSKDIGPHNVLLITKQEFVEQFLFLHAEAGSLIVGFNLPFDLSRLASKAMPATRVDKDWSLLFRNESSNPDTLRKLSFRIKIDRKDGKIAFFGLSGVFVRRGRFSSEGRFLDLFALAWALTNTSYKLKSLAKDLKKRGYKVPRKLDHEPTGRVTPEEIAYCRQDVRVTAGVLNALRSEFDLHRDIDLNPDNALSPASMFKAYLRGMGILFPSKKFNLSPRIQGIAAQGYYGGRSEVRIRHADVPVIHTDYLSEYPTVILLMGLWDFLTARRLRVRPAVQEVRTLLTKIVRSPDLVFEQNLWKEFTGYALVEPHDDVLPIRTEYNEKSDENNIGVNILERADYPIWFAIPDLVASTLLTGKAPKILKAIRVFPEGKQRGLHPVALRGKEIVDPISGNLFKSLIEAKQREKKNDENQAYFLKIMANSGYGIFIETTPRRVAEAQRTKVFAGERQFPTTSKIIEDKGKFYCPVISSVITAGGRLLLAILEREVKEVGGTYLFCDTDSMAIVAEKANRTVRLSDPEAHEQQKIETISRIQLMAIVTKLERLNPYGFPGLLKVEHKSLSRQVYGFAISAKRYCLFDEKYRIVHASSHGLGHLYVPKSKWIKKMEVREWVKEAWERIIRKDPSAKSLPWFSHPAMMRIAMTTPKVRVWKIIEQKQAGLPYRKQFKPRNFFLSPIIDKVGDEKHRDGFPKGAKNKNLLLVAPSNPNSDNGYGLQYTNVHNGKRVRLVPIANKKDSEASPQTLEQVVRIHPLHAESKSLGPDGKPCTSLTRGLLQRTRITAVGKPRNIGKETDRKWEQEEDPSIFEPTLVEYRENETARITTDARLQSKIRSDGRPGRELARKIGVNPSTLQRARTGKRIRKVSATKIWNFLENTHRKPS